MSRLLTDFVITTTRTLCWTSSNQSRAGCWSSWTCPELETTGPAEGRRRVEVYRTATDDWRRASVEAIALDGRVRVRWDDEPGRPEDVDLTASRHRWLMGPPARQWEEDGGAGVADLLEPREEAPPAELHDPEGEE